MSKLLIISVVILFLIYRIAKYYYKIQQLNYQKQKESKPTTKQNSYAKPVQWEAETIDFEEVKK